MALFILASVLNCFGVIALYLRWTNQVPKYLTYVAWGFQFFSIYVWAKAFGAEFGLVYACAGLSIFAWLVILAKQYRFTTSSPPEKHSRESKKFQFQVSEFGRAFPKHLGILVLVVVLCGLSSTLTTIMLVDFLPLSILNRMVTNVFIIPIVWGTAAYWAIAHSSVWRVIAVLSFTTIISAVKLFVL